MQFTYDWYASLISIIKDSGYTIVDYHSWRDDLQCAILRHDIDYDLKKAVDMALLEQSLGVRSTYFLLLTSDFYNVFSKESCWCINKILSCGHELGLHFDETRYPEIGTDIKMIQEKISEECSFLGQAIGTKITTVSMHRPSKTILDSNLAIPGITNSYSDVFFREFKYLSDSRRKWREPVEEIVKSKHFQKLHILTHAFWYNEKQNDLQESILSFINSGNIRRYDLMSRNFARIEEVVDRSQVLVPYVGGANEKTNSINW